MKNQFLLMTLGLTLLASYSQAYIPLSGVTSLKANLYAMYTTADATCQTGLVATLPMRASPVVGDATQSLPLTSGASISNPVNCIIMVLQNQTTTVIAPGSYTGTSSWSPASTGNADSVCNAGTTISTGYIANTAVSQTVTWPAQITKDLTAVGLTGASVTSSSHSDIYPVYISTNSKCSANYSVDQNVTGCTGYGSTTFLPTTNVFTPPLTSGSTTAGIVLSGSVSGTSATGYKLVSNPSFSVGGVTGLSCGIWGFPLYSFTAK